MSGFEQYLETGLYEIKRQQRDSALCAMKILVMSATTSSTVKAKNYLVSETNSLYNFLTTGKAAVKSQMKSFVGRFMLKWRHHTPGRTNLPRDTESVWKAGPIKLSLSSRNLCICI